jgi:hypothetical protein
MGQALELITGFVTAPSTTLTALTMAAGNSLTVRNAPSGMARLLTFWTDSQGIGQLQVRSPRMHDNVQGITVGTQISEVQPLTPWGMPQQLYPQDTLTALLSGSATAGDIETASMLIHYDDLPGTDARLARWSEVESNIESIMISTNTLSLGTAGGYSGQEAINAEVDDWKANRDYVLIGYQTTVECACIRWVGSDTGNLGVGGPGHENFKSLTGDWFRRLSESFDLPLMPIFNAANKNGILIDGAQDENGSDPLVTSIFGLLKA